MAIYDGMVAPMLAAQALYESKDAMSPDEVRRQTLIATDDQFLADLEWRRAVDRKMDQYKPEGI